MLTTAPIALAARAAPVAAADLLGERRHPVEHLVDRADDVLAGHLDALAARGAQRDVQHGPVLGDVDRLAREHRVDPLAKPGLLGQREQQVERLARDPLL